MARADRISERFKSIKMAMEELHGKPLTFAAVSCAWLRVIQYGTDASMKQIMDLAQEEELLVMGERRKELDAEHELMLRGFHEELCSYLEVDVEAAIELSKSFDQVVHDLCFQGG